MIEGINAISFKNVYQSYRDKEKPILNGVNLEIENGEFCIILGRSGTGKSTLLRCMNGLVEPYKGEIIMCGEEITKETTSLRQVRKKIGMIFQHYNLVNRLTAIENVICGMLPGIPLYRSLVGVFNEKEKAKALQLLDKVGIKELAYHRVDQLSGGQKQRVGIARALAQNPQLILADEPVASLDPVTSSEILQLLLDISEKDGITVVVSLHQIDLAKQYGKRIIALNNGRISLDCKGEHLTQEDVDRIYTKVAL